VGGGRSAREFCLGKIKKKEQGSDGRGQKGKGMELLRKKLGWDTLARKTPQKKALSKEKWPEDKNMISNTEGKKNRSLNLGTLQGKELRNVLGTMDTYCKKSSYQGEIKKLQGNNYGGGGVE